MKKTTVILGLVILILVSYRVYEIFRPDGPDGVAVIEPEQQANVAVNVGKVEKMTMRSYVTAFGTIQSDPGNNQTLPASVKITASCSGIIKKVNCAEGQRVDKGQVLFCMDSRMADVAVEKAKQAVSFAEKNFQRQEKLKKMEGTSDKLYLEAKSALDDARSELASAIIQQKLLSITTPFAGTITKMTVNAGQAVDMAQELAELRDLNRVVVAATVPNREVPKLKLKQQVEINGANDTADGSAVITGRLNYISPEVNPETNTVVVWASVPAGSLLRNGQFVKIRIITDVVSDCLAVPRESVYTDHEGRSTLSVVEGDIAKQKTVETGYRDGDFVQIKGDGLAEGAKVVTLGSYALPDETKVTILTGSKEEEGK